MTSLANTLRYDRFVSYVERTCLHICIELGQKLGLFSAMIEFQCRIKWRCLLLLPIMLGNLFY